MVFWNVGPRSIKSQTNDGSQRTQREETFPVSESKQNKRRRAIAPVASLLIGVLPLLVTACSEDEIFGTPRIKTTITTPTGVQNVSITIAYTLSDSEKTSTDVEGLYSTDGVIFLTATEGTGGSGKTGLSISKAGDAHTFVWDSGDDLPDLRSTTIFFRIAPVGGTPGTTAAFTLHNFVYMVVGEATATAAFSLYELGLSDGDISLEDSVTPGGDTPLDILFHDGVFFAANSVSNNVTALVLDEVNIELDTVTGSPFACDGTTPSFLAADGTFLFVSNTGTDTISIFNITSGTGALALNASSGVSVTGCLALEVYDGRLFVADGAGARIVIFDIQANGSLVANAASPVTGGGLASPRSLALIGSKLYAANNGVASVAGFQIEAAGGLTALAGSPYTFAQSGVKDMDSDGSSRLFLVGGAFNSFTTMTTDAAGAATEDAASPKAVTGPANAVVSPPGAVVVGTTTTETLESFSINSAGTLISASGSPFDSEDDVERIAVSD
jgi:hypothetical protein